MSQSSSIERLSNGLPVYAEGPRDRVLVETESVELADLGAEDLVREGIVNAEHGERHRQLGGGSNW